MSADSRPRPRPDSSGRAPARRATALLRLVVGTLVLGAIAYQIADLALHDALAPEEYFSYFTIQSCLAIGVLLVVGGVIALRLPEDPIALARVGAAALPFAVVTGVVYNVLLRGPVAPGYQGSQIPNEIMHVVVPIAVVVEWLVAAGRPRAPWSALAIAAAYPLTWLGLTLLRGSVDGWYPYPFVDPTGPSGAAGVVGYTVGLTAFILLVATLGILWTRRRRRPREGGGPGGSPRRADRGSTQPDSVVAPS